MAKKFIKLLRMLKKPKNLLKALTIISIGASLMEIGNSTEGSSESSQFQHKQQQFPTKFK